MKTQRYSHIRGAIELARAQNSWPVALMVLALAAATATAQTVTMRANPVRITVPYGTTSSNFSTVTIVASNLLGGAVNFNVTGVPAGATAVFSTNSINVDGTHTAGLTVQTTAALAQGTYDVAIEASGAAAYRLPVPLIASYIWSGSAFTNSGDASFSTLGNWQGGAAPYPTNTVVFGDMGATTNTSGVNTTNIIISADAEMAGLRFAQYQGGSTRYQNIQLNPGVTLKVSGPDGFGLLRDSKGVAQAMDVRIFGNGNLVVTNAAASFGTFIDYQQNATLDMRDLGNFQFDGVRMPFGDYRAYPNYFTNGWIGTSTGQAINRFVSLVWLARTNFIKASFVDPNGYADLGQRDYSLAIGNNNIQGSTSNLRLSLGYSNVFFLDSICWGQALAGGSGNNYNFLNAGSYALFRGAAGPDSRMSVFAISDSASPAAPAASNCRGQVNFANGYVDALVDQLWVSVDRTNNNGQMTLQGSLTLASGTFDVNNAYLGYQRSGNNQGSDAATGFAGPEGTVTLNSNSVLKVNQTLNLGYTTASAPGGTTSAERCFGRVVVNNTAVCMASNIVVGGVTKLTTNSSIILGGGRLIVTNAIGAPDARLASLSITNGSELVLYGVQVGATNVFVNRLVAPVAGPAGVIRIPTISNVSGSSFTIPIISYVGASPVFNGLTVVPPGGLFVLSVVDNTMNQTIDVTFSTTVPQVLVWRGNHDNNWDTSTLNWVTLAGGLETNFANGDSVIFDDTATGPTTINMPSAVAPGQYANPYGITVSNTALSYTFGSGDVLGGSTLLKVGAGSLTVNANLSPGILLSGGSLTGGGTVGPTSLGDGTTMTSFSGTINGGLASSNANATVVGTVNGGLRVLAGTVVNNSTINGTVAMATNTVLNNTVGATMNVTLPWTVTTNSVLINNGSIYHLGTSGQNLGLTVNGTLKGTGRISQNGNQLPSDVRVTMGPGGLLQIGNNPGQIANTTIAVRLDLLAGSTTVFDVDTATPANDKILLTDGFIQGKVNFGAGNNLGGTLLINRIAGPAFNLATAISLFDLTANLPDNSQPAIPRAIPAPAAGLTWDTSQVISNLTLAVTTIPVYTNSITTSTNGTKSLVFEWPANYRGWRLECQTNSLAVGLDFNGTNWTTVFTALGGTNVLYYPDITNTPDVFWLRSVQTISTTNSGPVAPTAFYRLVYP